MNRRNFLKGFSAVTGALAIAPAIALKPLKEAIIPDWSGSLIPYGVYSDGINIFMAISRSEIININPDVKDVEIPERLVPAGLGIFL